MTAPTTTKKPASKKADGLPVLVEANQAAIEAKTGEQYIAEAVAEVVKVSQTDIGIEKLKEQYESLECKSLEDRPVYFAIVEGAKRVKALRLAVESKRKELNEFPLKYQRAVNAEAKRITEELSPLEAKLLAEKTKFEDAEAAEKAKQERAKRDALTAAGFVFDGMSYVCGMHVVPSGSVAAMEDGQIEFYVQEAAKIKQMEAAAEKRRQDELAELERKRKEAEAEQAELARQKADFEAEKAEFEEFKRLKAEEKLRETLSAESPRNQTPVASSQPAIAATGHGTVEPEPPAPEFQSPTDALNSFETATQIPDESFSAQFPLEPSPEYIDGFEHCKTLVLAIFADPTPRTRPQFVQLIEALKP